MREGGLWRLAAAALLLAGLALILPGFATAESAWVKDEVKLNLRTGPGTQYRIVATIGTGDAVEVLERTETWTKIRANGTDVGWIPAGYLQVEMPARLRLEKWESQVSQTSSQLAELERETKRLREENERLASRDGERDAELARLSQENIELRAGARWPERVAGAAILLVGMLLGAVLQRRSARRSSPRIRI